MLLLYENLYYWAYSTDKRIAQYLHTYYTLPITIYLLNTCFIRIILPSLFRSPVIMWEEKSKL